MLKEALLSVVNAIWYLFTRRHILEGKFHRKTGRGLPPSYVASHQPEWDDFIEIVREMDPEHKFTTDLVRATLRTT